MGLPTISANELATIKASALAANPDMVIEDSASPHAANGTQPQQDAGASPIVVPVASIINATEVKTNAAFVLPPNNPVLVTPVTAVQQLVAEANAEHEVLKKALVQSAISVIRLGDICNRVKDEVGHANWINVYPTLGFSFVIQTARRYMKCAKKFAGKTDSASVLETMTKGELFKLAGVNKPKPATKPGKRSGKKANIAATHTVAEDEEASQKSVHPYGIRAIEDNWVAIKWEPDVTPETVSIFTALQTPDDKNDGVIWADKLNTVIADLKGKNSGKCIQTSILVEVVSETPQVDHGGKK